MDKHYNTLELREIFHLEFLRWLSRKIKPAFYALKGGVNLRFFFNSIRYSEDMDIDAQKIEVFKLKENILEILNTASFKNILKPFGIQNITPPDIKKAKQTETTQRFKIHLITYSGEDLFTKVEFSRRGFKGNVVVENISDNILRNYKLAPLLVPHYDISSTIAQKIDALYSRSITQPRDIFDLYMLSSQHTFSKDSKIKIPKIRLKNAYNNIFKISFPEFRDIALSYLKEEDQTIYNSSSSWEEMQIKVANFIEEIKNHG